MSALEMSASYGESLSVVGEKLTRCIERGTQAIPLQVNPSVASLYIANPLGNQGLSGLFQTHPPLQERIRRLRELRLA